MKAGRGASILILPNSLQEKKNIHLGTYFQRKRLGKYRHHTAKNIGDKPRTTWDTLKLHWLPKGRDGCMEKWMGNHKGQNQGQQPQATYWMGATEMETVGTGIFDSQDQDCWPKLFPNMDYHLAQSAEDTLRNHMVKDISWDQQLGKMAVFAMTIG